MIPTQTSVGALTATQATDVLQGATGPAWFGEPSWWIGCTTAGFELRADPSVWSPGAELVGRRVRMGAGASLMNLQLAVRAVGVSAVVELLPYAARPDVLGALRASSPMTATAADIALVHAQELLPVARASRAAPATEPVRNALRRAARIEGAWLATISQQLQARFDDLAAAGAPGHQLVAVVCTLDDRPLAQLKAGQGLQRVLLTAMTLGLQPDVEFHLVEDPATRQLLRELLGGALWPHAVLRMNYREPAPVPAIRSGGPATQS